MRLISRRQRVLTITHTRDFSYIDPNGTDSGAGCSFPCDKDGNVDLASLHPCAVDNYNQALSGFNHHIVGAMYHTVRDAEGDVTYIPFYCTGRWETQTVRDEGVVVSEHVYNQPAVGECGCGKHVTLHGFTNTCECGRDYNSSGQLLASRSQWGEETGESLSDILSIR